MVASAARQCSWRHQLPPSGELNWRWYPRMRIPRKLTFAPSPNPTTRERPIPHTNTAKPPGGAARSGSVIVGPSRLLLRVFVPKAM